MIMHFIYMFFAAGLMEELKQRIVYEDEGLLVMNKPSGLAVHGGSGVSLGLIEALRTLYPQTQFLELVHRLDRDTSGCVLVAKSRPSLRALHKQFREDLIDKYYHLAVFGKWPKHKRVVDAPLRRSELRSGERMVCVAQDGKPSKTEFRSLKSTQHFTLLEAKPITGRTHQIRVHAAFSGCPIVGDSKYIQGIEQYYGTEKCRLMLHAKRLAFSLRSGKRITIEAEYDQRYVEALALMELE